MRYGPLCSAWFAGNQHEGFGGWFRIFGYGLHIRSARGYQPLFSERYGYTKPLYLFGLRIEVLKP